MKIPSLLAGVAGEYFVAAELSRRGHIASISLRNTRGIDILVTNGDGSRSVTIQCKTNQSGRSVWILNEKCETFIAPSHFYVLIALGKVNERSRYFVVPSCDVAEYVSRTHREWLLRPGRGGRKHVDNPVRNFCAEEHYLERWDLLGL